MDEWDERDDVFIVSVIEGTDADYRWAFAIVGTDYPSSEAVTRARNEAYEALESRNIPAEFERRGKDNPGAAASLPRWESYRKKWARD